MNKFKMIKSNVGKVHNDLEKYHLQFPRESKYYELEKS